MQGGRNNDITFLSYSTAMDSLMSDINGITNKVKDISDQISKTGDDFKSQMASFLMVSLFVWITTPEIS